MISQISLGKFFKAIRLRGFIVILLFIIAIIQYIRELAQPGYESELVFVVFLTISRVIALINSLIIMYFGIQLSVQLENKVFSKFVANIIVVYILDLFLFVYGYLITPLADRISNPFIDPSRNGLVIDLLTIGKEGVVVLYAIITIIAYSNLNAFIQNENFPREEKSGCELIKFGYSLMLFSYLINLIWLLTVLMFDIGVVNTEIPSLVWWIFVILRGIFLLAFIPLFLGHLRAGKNNLIFGK